MLRIFKRFLAGFCFMLLMANLAAAHCEIPCGIYGDEMRVQMILEHIATIEKSMQQISAIEAEKPLNSNQLVRWVTNKEQHANDLQEIVSQYFMTQRISPEVENYQAQLSTLHEMLIAGMKCKQTTNLTHPGRLRTLIAEFEKLYFAKPHSG